MTVKASEHKCIACKKPVSVEFAVEVDEGYAHQSCFRRGL